MNPPLRKARRPRRDRWAAAASGAFIRSSALPPSLSPISVPRGIALPAAVSTRICGRYALARSGTPCHQRSICRMTSRAPLSVWQPTSIPSALTDFALIAYSSNSQYPFFCRIFLLSSVNKWFFLDKLYSIAPYPAQDSEFFV